ncbi:hypothetical protein ACLIYP_16525 [Streptomyces nanhaiensis]|uniref:hypothetical protein n=1 Tax=Streptomyces nanhaiensis TaxID=679319 RepID=UPI00399D3FC6
MTEAALRRLIAEGSRPGSGLRGSGSRGSGDLPSDDSLRALAAVLSAAVPPPGSGVLKGEEEALAAFRAARDERAAADPGAAGLRGRLTRLTRRLGRTRTGTLGVVVAAVLGSGVAAASVGVPFLPGSGPNGAPGTSRVPDTASTPPVPTSPKAPTTGEAGPAGPHPDGSGPGAVPPSEASPRIVALCRVQERNPGSPAGVARKPLVTAAGGRDRVAEYCDAVLEGPAVRPSPADGGRDGGNQGNGVDGNGGGNSGGNGNDGGDPGGNGATPGTPNRPGEAPGNPGGPGTPGGGNGGGNGNPGNGAGRGNADQTGTRPGGGSGGGRDTGNPGNGNNGGNGGRDGGNPGNGNGTGGNGAGGNDNGTGPRAEAARDRAVPANRPAAAPAGGAVP